MKRLDVLLYEQKLFPTREKAKEAVTQGIIFCNEKKCTKPGEKFPDNSTFSIKGQMLNYVSRAGLKLEKAQQEWHIDFSGKIVIDVGASTGGFSDFALQNGAKKIYAVDVGSGQLHPKIKENPDVINMEKCDFRTLAPLPDKIDIAVCDCSFISLKLLLPKFAELLPPNAELVVLIKPQFECGKQIAQKTHGIIKDEKLQLSIKNDIINTFSSIGFSLVGACESPILGTAGNKEFLAYFKKNY